MTLSGTTTCDEADIDASPSTLAPIPTVASATLQAAPMRPLADMDALMGAMQSEAAAEAMAHDGVLPETLVILIEAWFATSAPGSTERGGSGRAAGPRYGRPLARSMKASSHADARFVAPLQSGETRTLMTGPSLPRHRIFESMKQIADERTHPQPGKPQEGGSSVARHRARRKRRRVPLPDPPVPVAQSPDVRHDKHATSVHPADRRLHVRTLQDGGDLAVNVDQLFLHVVGVHNVVGQCRQPAVSRHDGRDWLDEYKCILGVEHPLRRVTVALGDASLELGDGQFQVHAHPAIVPRPHGRLPPITTPF